MDVVLSWLWQGGLVALAAMAILHPIPRSRPHTRYCFLWAACLLVLVLPAASYLMAAAPPELPQGDTSGSIGPLLSLPITWWTSPVLAITLWIVWFATCAARLAVNVMAVRKVRRQSLECPADVQARLHHWLRLKTTGRRTRVVVSTRVRFAGVLGCGAPVIVLAPTLLEELSREDLDRVVIHEWAHVQRRDDVAQLVQRVVHMAAGWHPAMWWLDRRLEFEREVACDSIAVATTGCARRYAACLLTLATLRSRSVQPLPALAAASSGGLRRRIVRILAGPSDVPAWRARAIGLSAGIILAAVAWSAGSVQPVARVAMLSPPSATRSVTRSNVVHASDASVVLEETDASARSLTTGAAVPRRIRPTKRNEPPRADSRTAGTDRQPTTSALVPLPPRPSGLPLRFPASPLVAGGRPDAILVAAGETGSGVKPTGGDRRLEQRRENRWAAAVDGGMAVGRGSRTAGVAIGGFFSRFGKKISDSF